MSALFHRWGHGPREGRNLLRHSCRGRTKSASFGGGGCLRLFPPDPAALKLNHQLSVKQRRGNLALGLGGECVVQQTTIVFSSFTS